MISNSESPGDFFCGTVNHFTSSEHYSVEYPPVPGQLPAANLASLVRRLAEVKALREMVQMAEAATLRRK
jgi:hypothetical protein